jgi:HD-like signal output (HDOD) protein
MVLAEDLVHSNGRYLFGKGTALDEDHRRILKIWGIHSVEIEGGIDDSDPSIADECDPALLQAAETLVAKRFTPGSLDHPFFKELLHICTLRKAQQLAEKGPLNKDAVSSAPEPVPVSVSELARPSPRNGVTPQTLIDREPALASLPNVFMEICNVIDDPRSSAVHIADVISKDMNLSAKLLRLVNSAFYRFPSKIHTISRAVMMIGTKQLSTLALGTSAITMFKNIPVDFVDMELFWRHSIACGVSARMIASYMNIFNTERLFVAGLLHDIGRIILYTRIPHQAREILTRAAETNGLLRDAEIEALGWDHAQLGGLLLKKWRFPLMLEHGVRYHHDPFKSQYPLEASIVCLSDVLANALEMGSSGEHLVPPMMPVVLDKLGFEKAALAEIVQLIKRQVAEILYLFFGERWA